MERKWWKESVMYRVFPRSFYDSDQDGIGDLQGIIQKIPYIKSVGANVLWLSPIFRSPGVDSGYDVSDYMSIMDEFGTLADFDLLVRALHKEGMKIILDMPVNHTSILHPWFIESRSSNRGAKREYYAWRPADEDGRKPSNWSSFFADSAWQLDEETNEFYLHMFTENQPELNWYSERVRGEFVDIFKFWAEKGADGFNLFGVSLIGKPQENTGSKSFRERRLVLDYKSMMHQPATHRFLKELRQELEQQYDLLLMGETPKATPEQVLQYTQTFRHELNMAQPSELAETDTGPGGRYDRRVFRLAPFKKAITRWQLALGDTSWNSLVFGDLNQPRMLSRFGNDSGTEHRTYSAKMLSTLMMTLQGTPCIYQGDEIGMTNCMFTSIEEYRDSQGIDFYKRVLNFDLSPAAIMRILSQRGRDSARTPMQWNMTPNAGFSKGTPWIKVNPNFLRINVELAEQEPYSVLNYYRKAIQMRLEHPTLIYGKYLPLEEKNEQLFCYLRHDNKERYMVVLNFTQGYQIFTPLEIIANSDAELILCNYEEPYGAEALLPEKPLRYFKSDKGTKPKEKNLVRRIGSVSLRPYEARVYKFV